MTQQTALSWHPLLGAPSTGLEDGLLKRALNLGCNVGGFGVGFDSEPGPLIIPNPYETDDAGQSFPAGTVGLIYAMPGPDDWDGDLETLGDLVQPIMIPSSLPSGYTLVNSHCCRKVRGSGIIRVPSIARFYRNGVRSSFLYGFPSYDITSSGCNLFGDYLPTDPIHNWNYPRVWENGSLWQHRWGPYALGKSVLAIGAFSTSTGTPSTPETEVLNTWVNIKHGVRYSFFRCTLFTGNVNQIEIEITRTADWTEGLPGVAGPIGVNTVSTGSLSASFGDLPTGEILPVEGTLEAWVHVSVKITGSPAGGYAVNAASFAGPRMDIPICCTVAYRDWLDNAHVIPGGYRAELLETPPWGPSPITDSYSGFAAETLGDGQFVYAYHFGTPGGSYTLQSDGFNVGGVQIFQGEHPTGEPASGSGPPGFGPWSFTKGSSPYTWFIIDVRADDGTLARFRVV
jgi:hypothetical protein